MCAYKKLCNIKNITQIKIGKRQHYSKLNRKKAKLYVSIMYRLRGLIMELYILLSSNGCASGYIEKTYLHFTFTHSILIYIEARGVCR